MRGFPRFQGNWPRNVSRDAKYSVRRQGAGNLVVGLLYRTADRETWRATTDQHPDLVAMVNEVKVSMGESPNGPFYINEFRQVIVPVGRAVTYYLAGEYHGDLRFEFEGHILSGEARDPEGRPLEPGDVWVGPHPGIPYRLQAGGADIYYETEPRPNVTRKELLSDYVGKELAAHMARRVRQVKGWEGGRFYVNEWREMFAPVWSGPRGRVSDPGAASEEGELRYVYIGHLDMDDPWFPKPT